MKPDERKRTTGVSFGYENMDDDLNPVMSKPEERVAEAEKEGQTSFLDDSIEDTTTYYVICDECHGCYDMPTFGVGNSMYDEGWRVKENANGQRLVMCPDCAKKESQ